MAMMNISIHPESFNNSHNALNSPAWPTNKDTLPPSRLRMQQEIGLEEKIGQGNGRLSQMRRGMPLSVLLNTEEEKKKTCAEDSSTLTPEDKETVYTPLCPSSPSPPIVQHQQALVSCEAATEKGLLKEEIKPKVSFVLPLHESAKNVIEEVENQGHEINNFSNSPGLQGDPVGEALVRLRARRKKRKLNSKYFSKSTDQSEAPFCDLETTVWHRRLSIIFWIMDTMKISDPYLRRPFTTCWQLCQPDINPEEAKKHFEKTKLALAKWESIEATATKEQADSQERTVKRFLTRKLSKKFKSAAIISKIGVSISRDEKKLKNNIIREEKEEIEYENATLDVESCPKSERAISSNPASMTQGHPSKSGQKIPP